MAALTTLARRPILLVMVAVVAVVVADDKVAVAIGGGLVVSLAIAINLIRGRTPDDR